jgi:hypothetical protein
VGQSKFAEKAPLASVVTLVPTWVAVVVLAQSVTVAPTMAWDEPSMTVPATVFAPVGVPPDEEEAPLDELLLLEVVPPEEELLLEEVEPEEELLVPPEELLEEELLEAPLDDPLDELVPPGAVPEVAGAPPPPPPPHATKVSVAATVNA